MEREIMVTVILTVYKRTEYLEIALKSALNQTMNKFEIIIADDSGHRIAEPIYELYKQNDRIIYQPNPETLGIVSNVKVAMEKSRGNFISILNDDDSWEENFLEKLYNSLLKNSDCVLAFSDHWIMNATGEVDSIETELNTKRYKRDELEPGKANDPKSIVLKNNSIPLAMATLFRKDAIDLTMLVPDVSGAYDFWISCLLASTNKPFYYQNERLTRYRVHSQMETGRRAIDKDLNMVYIYKSLIGMESFFEHKKSIIGKYAFSLYRVGKEYLYFGKFENSRLYFKNSIKISFDHRPLLLFGLSYLPAKILKKIHLLTSSH